MRNAILFVLMTVWLAGCSPSSCSNSSQPTEYVFITVREPFDFSNYQDPKDPLILDPHNPIPYISVLCIQNQTTSPFIFDPTKLFIYLGQQNGAAGPSEAHWAGLLYSSSGGFSWFGGPQWNAPASLGMSTYQVGPFQAGVGPAKAVMPASFTAIAAGMDDDPADAPNTSIPGDPNHVRPHSMEYCPGGLSATSPPGTCAPYGGLIVRVMSMQQSIAQDGSLQNFNPVYLYNVDTQDFASAEIVSQPQFKQNLPPPNQACQTVPGSQ
jgi:hypothetical protein